MYFISNKAIPLLTTQMIIQSNVYFRKNSFLKLFWFFENSFNTQIEYRICF